MKLVMPLVVLAACAAQAQMLKIPPSFDKLADKAEEVADVTLNANMLGMASKFLSDKDPDEKAAKRQLLLALRVTGSSLRAVHDKVHELSAGYSDAQ